jgi:ABC-type lipoprotein release transport system permease subunit
MAWRNVGRNRRRSAVTVAAITLAFYSMVIFTGMLRGMLDEMEETVVEVEIGDVQIHTVEYLNRPSIYELVEGTDALIPALQEAGFRVSPRLLGSGLVAARESSAGAQLRGLDVALDATVSDISQRVADGQWLDSGDPLGVVLGRRLAGGLDLRVGDELVALSQATDGSMANDLFSVRGILATVGDSVDRSAVFVNAATFREFFVLPDGVHEIVVRRPADLELAVATETVRTFAPGLDTKSWRELVPTLATYFDTAQQAIQIVAAVVYIVIAILVLNAMLMAVFERIREFGVLKALGVEPGRVMALIVAESGLQTALAIAIGLALAAPTLWYLAEFGIDTGGLGGTAVMGMTLASIWYATVTPSTVVGPLLTLVILVGAGVIYPALKAARISPIEAMRYQ